METDEIVLSLFSLVSPNGSNRDPGEEGSVTGTLRLSPYRSFGDADAGRRPTSASDFAANLTGQIGSKVNRSELLGITGCYVSWSSSDRIPSARIIELAYPDVRALISIVNWDERSNSCALD